MRIIDWSSDVCSSDLVATLVRVLREQQQLQLLGEAPDLELGFLGLGPEELLVVTLGLLRQLPGRLGIADGGAQAAADVDDVLQLPVAPGRLRVAGLIGDQLGVAEGRCSEARRVGKECAQKYR